MNTSIPTVHATAASALPVPQAVLPTLRAEWRMLRADPAFWAVLVLLVASIFYAVHAGQRHWQRQASLVAAAQAEEQQRRDKLRRDFEAVVAGTMQPASPFRDPRSALWVGMTHGATVVALAPAPLAAAAVGLSDLHPATLRISARTKDEFLFADEIRNPLHLLAGAVDLAFVLVFVLPLALLALGYNLVSSEREQGTLVLAACTGADLRRVLLTKLVVRAGVPLGVTLVAISAALLGLAGAALGTELALLWLATALYGAFWALLAAWVNSRGFDSAHNALLLATAWIVLVLVLPATVNSVAETWHPTPSRAEMVLAVRGATVDADRERDAALARYREEHGHEPPEALRRGSAAERVIRRVAVVDAGAARVQAVIDQHDAQLARRQRLVERLAFASPALLMQLAATDAAGSGSARFSAFYRQVDDFHKRWRDFFFSRARAGLALTAADYSAFPRWDAAAPPVAVATLTPRLGGLALMALALGVLAWRGLRRVDRRD